MSRPTCAAKTCYNSHYNKPLLKFFHFPNDENRSRQWIKHSGRDDLYDVPLDKLSKKYFLCADHFDAKWFLHPKFKTKFKSYVEPIPTIFLNNFTEFLPKSVQNKLLTKVVDGEQASNLNEELNKESKMESVWIDEEKLCRLCASYVFSNEYKNIFSESNSHLKDMIEYLLPEMVSEDELPHDVCNSCEVKVKECIDTILGFEEVYKCLKKSIEDKSNNVNERQDDNTALKGIKNHKNVKESYSNNDSYTGENESGISAADERATQFCKAQIADGNISKSIMLKCSYCTAEFNSHNSLKCHEKQIHLQFKKHYLQSQINSPIGGTKCSECNKTMSTDKIKVHMASHKPKENQCEYCGMQYKTKRRLDNHLITHLGDPFCSFCGKEFNNTSQKRLHEKTHIENKNPEFLCYICGRLFTDQQALDDHIKNHDKINAYDCNICNKTFNTESLLQLHLDSYSKYSCPICGKEFHLKARVQQHLLTHSGVSPFTCFCGVAFNRSGNLTQHIKLRHSRESDEKGTKQTFQCSVCNRKLKSKMRLKWHLAKHAGDKKPYDCEHCDKKYASIFKYKNHLRTHTGERPFACTYCSRTFSNKANMKQHELIHQDIYPHRCMTCDRVFKRIQSLIIHKRTHTGERPFVCPVCNKGFLQKYDLQKHMKTHNKSSNGSDQSLNSLLSSNLIDMPDLQTLASVNVVPPGTSSSSLQLFSVNDISQLTLTGADLQILNMPIVEIQPLM